MKKIITITLILSLLLSGCALAEAVPGIEGLVYGDDRITGTLDTPYGYQLQVDMPIPPENTDKVKQYKMESMTMTRKQVKQLLSGKVLTDVPDAKWIYRASDDSDENISFQFQEDSLKYTWPFCYHRYSPLDSTIASDKLLNAEAIVRSIIDTMNISYEYPFYTVSKACQTLDTQLQPVDIENEDDAARILLKENTEKGEYYYNFISSCKGFDDEYLYVFVRLQADGIPFAYGSIVNQSYRDDNANPAGGSDEGVYLEFQLTSDGKITYAEASNIQTVVQEATESRPILPWTECLSALCTDSDSLSDMQSAMLVRAELCYAINQKHVTYPVWQFIVEIHYEGSEFPYGAYPWAFYVDAITGECL
jgi:hypothetical protein